MIITLLLTIAYQILSALTSVLPASEGLPTAVSDALAYVGTAINSVSYLIPVGSLFGALALVVTYEAAVWAFHGVMWVWKRIPFIGR